MSSLQVDSWVFPPFPGERFIICSDGLTNEVGDADIERIVGHHDDPQQAAEELVRTAVENGGRDNVTVIVVALDAADEDDSKPCRARRLSRTQESEQRGDDDEPA